MELGKSTYGRDKLNSQGRSFSQRYTLFQRQEKYQLISEKFQKGNENFMGIVLEKDPKSKFQLFTKSHYIIGVSSSSYVEEFKSSIIKNYLKLNPQKAFFLFCRNKLLNPSNKLKDLEIYKEQDGFVYLTCSQYSTY